jgi:3-oxoadipate enol-lactonase
MLLADLGESRVHVVGLSLGGCVALALALRTPARLRSLTIVNAFARPRPEGPRAYGRIMVRLALLGTAPMSVVAAYVARGLFPRPEQRHLYEAAVASLAATGRGAYVAALRALATFDVEASLETVRCPTLVVAGERDLTVPRSSAQRLARGIPGARLVLVADSGHATPLDQSDVFNKMVLEFIAAH